MQLQTLGLALFSPLILMACNGGSGSSTISEVTIPFSAKAHTITVNCDAELEHLGTDDASGSITNFAFFVHDVVLVNSDDSELPVTLDDNDWQSSGIGLLDFRDKLDSCASTEDKLTNTELSGSVQGSLDDVTAIRFTIGVPSDMNHEDTAAAASPLNRTDMFWSWQSGYKHLRMDVAADDSDVNTWNVHLGSTGCTGSAQEGETVSCTADNRPTVELTLGDDIRRQHIVVDYGKLVENSALKTNQGGAPGCMSGVTDPECPAIFDALGMGLGDNEEATPGQTVFSIDNAN